MDFGYLLGQDAYSDRLLDASTAATRCGNLPAAPQRCVVALNSVSEGSEIEFALRVLVNGMVAEINSKSDPDIPNAIELRKLNIVNIRRRGGDQHDVWFEACLHRVGRFHGACISGHAIVSTGGNFPNACFAEPPSVSETGVAEDRLLIQDGGVAPRWGG